MWGWDLRGIDTIEAIVAIVAIEVIGYIVVAELPLRGIAGRAQNIRPYGWMGIDAIEGGFLFGGGSGCGGVRSERVWGWL